MTIVAMAKKVVKTNISQSLSDNITLNYMINILGVLLEEFRRNQRLNIIKIWKTLDFTVKIQK